MSVTKEDYLCLSAMLRARENRMLSDDRAERMVEAESFEDASRLLSECGYPDFAGMDAAGIDRAPSTEHSCSGKRKGSRPRRSMWMRSESGMTITTPRP